DITIRGIYFDVRKGAKVYKRDGSVLTATVNDVKDECTAGIIGATSGAASGAKNITIENCKFDSTGASKYYVAISFEEQGRPTSRASDITVVGCSVNASIFNFIRANYLAEGTVVVKNNTVWEETYHSVMNLTGNASDIIIRNNTFGTSMMSDRYVMSNGWNRDKAMLGTSRQGSNHINIEVTGNKFIQQLSAEGHVIDLKSSYTQDNTTLVFENNTYVGMTESEVPCIWH
ncbi:MAG: hypothetical protein IKY40_06755, partial [Phascolarctobacterium sp.]|nr:hypothetical protein [Phascolarctobacterium sp.]